jgi:hypothetical protein
LAGSEPVSPAPRLPVQMGDGDDNEMIFLDVVNHAIWEAMSLATPGVFAQGMPGLGKGLDPLDCGTHLISELSP